MNCKECQKHGYCEVKEHIHWFDCKYIVRDVDKDEMPTVQK